MMLPWVHVVPEQLDASASIRNDPGALLKREPPTVAPSSTRLPPGCTMTSPPTVTLLSVHVAPAGTFRSLPVRLFGNVGVPEQLTVAAWAAGMASIPSAAATIQTNDAQVSARFMAVSPSLSPRRERNRRFGRRRGAICP